MNRFVGTTWNLRWRFEYASGVVRCGMWSNPGGPGNQAWNQNKEGLSYACIEGKHAFTKEEKVLVRCEGHRFRNFQWIAGHGVNSSYTEIVGMRLMMDEKAVEVFLDGRCVVQELSEGEKNIHFATYGR